MSDAAPQEQIEAWRRNGGWRVDPARFRFLEALAARVPEQREAVQAVLRSRLENALADYAQRVAAVPPPAPVSRRRAEPPLTPLAQLNAHIRAAAVARHGEATPSPDELASVRRFRQSWDRQHTLERLEEAVARKPANAGPLNSHALVLNTLALMRELSPDYLRQFVAHVEALQFIEKAREALPREKAKAKPAKKAHARRR
ncbi:DUF2894 domain-containing protein [Ramlibacter sp. G-1-2-2]|uniref:DUF2894 domain-containing protein n=1 Tax=Ramlibacter agri TaxID=2728837 RepID=A0A848HDS6_9BURK|nr:DUF2894 domain-containing protein [Ramlibacter agri]NML47630.1 DUF2894 domain-containing protein [Ramlibacter agri]